MLSASSVMALEQPNLPADIALAKLKDGNSRYTSFKMKHPNLQKERRAKTEKTILTISGVKKKYVRWNLISDVLFVLLVVFLKYLK